MQHPGARNESLTRIRASIDSIPSGRVATYGQLATLAALPGRARLVGRVLRTLPEGTDLPWHRVLNAQGRSSLDPRSPSGREQRRRLREEGVVIDGRGRVDLDRFRWTP